MASANFFKLAGNVYVLLADEVVNASHNEQLSICLRFINDEHECEEYFLGFVRFYDFDAVSLAKEISNYLVKHNIPMSTCIAQCYDCTAMMFGQYNGVHMKLQQYFMPKAIYIHSIIKVLEDLVKNDRNRAVDGRGICVNLGSVKNFVSTLCKQLTDMKNE
ncbi:unnamed protein product [Rotaria sordida]|uniref:DUF4371 domain-containing protein n=1 Tax=Rotaria sordida TaxID=392033 RepID=A0A814R6F9_9BILA|nr:unnamed protein product [Rotaria sordida]